MPEQPKPATAGAAAPTPDLDLRGVLRIAPFRRLWLALGLSSLGDWLGLLAMTAMAAQLTTSSAADQNYAVAGVFILRLIPAVIFGPIAGVVADKWDRRRTMVVCDIFRCLLFISIPIVGTLWWLLVATFLVEALSLFWLPAKDATVPNLVPPERLEAANQISLVTTYGSAPIAAAAFTVLSLITGVLGARYGFFIDNPAALALAINGLTFAVSAATIASLDIPKTAAGRDQATGFWRTMADGWRYVFATPVIRGLVLGMLGAFAAGGTVIGLAPTFVRGLGAGNPGYGVLFGAVFVGLAGGMMLGPRLLVGLSRRRMFALAIVGAGLVLMTIALIPQLPVVVFLTLGLGACAGIAWVTGYTLIGLEVADEVRGRTFAFVQSLVRITLVAVLAAAPLASGAIGGHTIRPTENTELTYSGAAIVFFAAGVVATVIGVVSYRHMDDRRGVSLWRDLVASARSEAFDVVHTGGGFFIAFEGGDGAGKSTQVTVLAEWLREKGHDVVVTREPGATEIGRRLREVLLDVRTTGLSPRTEALLYAADRAEHVDSVIRPALERGDVVVTDRYMDSSIAYQGAGRALAHSEVERLSRWATRGLRPNLTVVLDVPPEVAAARRQGPADRMESESLEFHTRVRQGFLDLAERDAKRYLVVDATLGVAEITAAVAERVGAMVPLSKREQEAIAEAEARARAELAAAQKVREEADAAERARAEAEAAEQARLASEAAEKERLEAEAAERAEAERAAAERAEAERAAAERAAAEAAVPEPDAPPADRPPLPDPGDYLLADELLGPWRGGKGKKEDRT